MMQLQALQPEMKKIQAQYKGRPSEAQRRAVEVLSREQHQPSRRLLAAARPDPVFIILYNVLKGLTATTEVVNGVEVFKPKYIDPPASSTKRCIPGTP